MYTYTPNTDPFFESLKFTEVDWDSMEPLIPQQAVGPKLFGEHNGMFGKKHNSTTILLMSEARRNKATVRDCEGNTLSVSKDDPRLLSGELVGIAKGKVAVKDSNGKHLLVDKTDPRLLSGELVGVNKGRKYKQKVPSPHKGTFLAKDINGNMCRLTKDDPRYISGEYIHFRSKF